MIAVWLPVFVYLTVWSVVLLAAERPEEVPVSRLQHPAVLDLKDAVQSTRIVQDRAFISADHKRYVMGLIRGHVSTNCVELEILAGELASAAAARPHTVARLFTSGLGGRGSGQAGNTVEELLEPVGSTDKLRWLDDKSIALIWADEREIAQVLQVDINTGAVTYLTHSKTDVTDFGVSPRGVVLYSSSVDYSPDLARRDRGYAVTSADAYSLMAELPPGTIIGGYTTERWEALPGIGNPTHIAIQHGGWNQLPRSYGTQPEFSPDGSYAVVLGTPSTLPDTWRSFGGGVHGSASFFSFREQLENQRHRPDGVIGFISQHFLVDIQAATARPLWDAPARQYGETKFLAWAPNGRSLLVGPTYLPVKQTNEIGLSGSAFAILDVHTGKLFQLPLSETEAEQVNSAQWDGDDDLELRTYVGKTLHVKRRGSDWIVRSTPSGRLRPRDTEANVDVEVREELNEPPTVYAIERRSGLKTRILDPNPDLRERANIAPVEIVTWTASDGWTWSGKLYRALGSEAGYPTPLVIQTNGIDTSHVAFSLYGPDFERLGPSPSASVAQPLASRGISVLQVSATPQDRAAFQAFLESKATELDQMRPFFAAYASGADTLVKRGLVDRSRVGLMGFSNRGWHVEHALAFSDFPYAAAIADDSKNGGYMQAALSGWDYYLADTLTGSPAFGVGLKSWLENSPTLNVERVKAPLLITNTSAGTIGTAGLVETWESFSRLRYLSKPVELYVIPNVERGAHNLQNPAQILALKSRALDWWLFWLRGEEDHSREKEAQYMSWRHLREMYRLDKQQPRPPLLHWRASPTAQTEAQE